MKLWIARDIDNILVLFLNKPVLSSNSGMWYVPFDSKDNPNNIVINRNLFPEVTFENSPQEVELKLIK
jgi:hypothetical protein